MGNQLFCNGYASAKTLGQGRHGRILAGPDLLAVYYLARAVRLAIRYIGSSKAAKLKETTAGMRSYSELERQIQAAIDEEVLFVMMPPRN